MEHSSKMELIKMGHSSKRNTHQKGTLISKRNSSKWNTHQKMELIKMEHSSKMEHSLKMEHWNPHQKWNSLNRNIHIIKKGTDTHHGMGTLISKGLSAT